MKANYELAIPVLSKLGYAEKEISEIISEIKNERFAYQKKASTLQLDWHKDANSGIDIPVLWTPDEGKAPKTVLLLAQDPLRDSDYWDEIYTPKQFSDDEKKNTVIIGTPYALHLSEEIKSKTLSNGKRKRWNINVYKKLIEAIVSKGYNVYCTDIFKYYFKQHKYDILDFDKNILQEEINHLKEYGLTHIICMGKKAQKGVMPILNVVQINVPHPKAYSQHWTDHFGFEERWSDDKKIEHIVESL